LAFNVEREPMERLTFNVGSSRGEPLVVAGRSVGDRAAAKAAGSPLARARAGVAAVRERYDWDYLWMLAFTALLFFRPQDHLPGLAALHLAELAAIGGLAAMAVRRMSAGQTIAHINGEVAAVIVLGGVMVLTIPFSIWPSGSLTVFSDIYVKIILIFALMMSTITSPRRVRQMTWIMIVASGYIAARAVFDYLRGVNLVEGSRVRGAVGGMFENPNDLALNLVTFLAPTLFIIFQDRKPSRRLFAGVLAVAMLAAIVFTKSRSGFLGLIAMAAVVLYYMAKAKPAILLAALLAGLVALPMMPSSFWERMDSITDADQDQTGSRAARLRLIDQGIEVFMDNPITGIGAGQFQNYNAPGVIEKWRVTHNVWLQVAAELGFFGFLTFGFLVMRAYASSFVALRLLRGPRKRRAPAPPRPSTATIGQARSAGHDRELDLTPDERQLLEINARGMIAAMVGWTVCSMFASVAFNWTFYYVLALAVAGREIVLSRRLAVESAAKPAPAPRLVRASA
jgi:putative inorganic carbon (HCO3(-)) transporter